jgi:hypothetical protein
MDQSKLSYFTSRYSALDRDELGDLVERRADLADEAIVALDQVLVQRGLSQTDVYTPPAPISPKTEEQEKAEVVKETRLAIKLLRSWVGTACKFMVAIVCIAPAQQLLRAVGLGAIWSGLVVLLVGYLGYQVGHSIVKAICANGDITFEQKRKRLWLLFAALWPIFGFVYAIALIVFQRS